jgi:hypothetical protein
MGSVCIDERASLRRLRDATCVSGLPIDESSVSAGAAGGGGLHARDSLGDACALARIVGVSPASRRQTSTLDADADANADADPNPHPSNRRGRTLDMHADLASAVPTLDRSCGPRMDRARHCVRHADPAWAEADPARADALPSFRRPMPETAPPWRRAQSSVGLHPTCVLNVLNMPVRSSSVTAGIVKELFESCVHNGRNAHARWPVCDADRPVRMHVSTGVQATPEPLQRAEVCARAHATPRKNTHDCRVLGSPRPSPVNVPMVRRLSRTLLVGATWEREYHAIPARPERSRHTTSSTRESSFVCSRRIPWVACRVPCTVYRPGAGSIGIAMVHTDHWPS